MHSITKMTVVSIPANKKVATANVTHIRMRRVPRTQPHPLAEIIGSRVDEGVPNRMTYDEIAKRSGGKISANYVNELRNGIKDPAKLSVIKIIGLAKGLGESPVVIFRAAMGQRQTHLGEESAEQVIADFSELPAKDREELRFIYDHFRAQVQERKDRLRRAEISSR